MYSGRAPVPALVLVSPVVARCRVPALHAIPLVVYFLLPILMNLFLKLAPFPRLKPFALFQWPWWEIVPLTTVQRSASSVSLDVLRAITPP